MRRHLDFAHPGFAVAPAGALQMVGGGCECIGKRVHQVTPSVAIKIDGEAGYVDGINCVCPKAPAHEP